MAGVMQAEAEVIATETAHFRVTAHHHIEVGAKTAHQPAAFIPFQGATVLTRDHGSLCSVVVALGVGSGARA